MFINIRIKLKPFISTLFNLIPVAFIYYSYQASGIDITTSAHGVHGVHEYRVENTVTFLGTCISINSG